MEIKRDAYLQQLIDFMWDGQVKVVTGIRRCGKSYLLRTLFRNYLLESGVSADNIITIELDLTRDIKYRNPLILAELGQSDPPQLDGESPCSVSCCPDALLYEACIVCRICYQLLSPESISYEGNQRGHIRC